MNSKIANFIKAYDALTESEKLELFNFINGRSTATATEKIVLNEELRKAQSINFAPAPGSCPACGR